MKILSMKGLVKKGAPYEAGIYTVKTEINRTTGKLKNVVKKVITNIGGVRNLFKSSVYGKIGKFRMQGEIHQWMYDRYSLTQYG